LKLAGSSDSMMAGACILMVSSASIVHASTLHEIKPAFIERAMLQRTTQVCEKNRQ
jgi:hypothetical protein